MEPVDNPVRDNVEVMPVVVLSRTFPARPSAIPEIRDFVSRSLAHSPLSEEDSRAVRTTVAEALLDAAGPTGAIQVSFRIFPDHVEVDVLKSHPTLAGTIGPDSVSSFLGSGPDHRADQAGGPAGGTDRRPVDPATGGPDHRPPNPDEPDEVAELDATSFAEWMSGVLRRQGMTMEAAARQLGVSVKTVSRWVGGTTEPRLRDLRRIQELFGELPFP